MSDKKFRKGHRLWYVDEQKEVVAEIENLRTFFDYTFRSRHSKRKLWYH